MTRRRAISLAVLLGGRSALAQNSAPLDPLAVFTEHPRLLLRPQRLRLLRRERERSSGRWQQFEALVQGRAPLPEPGFAQALYFRIADERAFGQKAITWALGATTDLHQQALVFDWCQELLTPAQARELASRLERGIARLAADDHAAAVRSRAFAAIALADHSAQASERGLEGVRQWWEAKVSPALAAGRDVIARDDAYPLWELLHAVRDSTNVDLRDTARRFCKEFPIEHLLSYYPASYPAAENEYRIGASQTPGEPDLRQAALSRVAELAMVAYDVNAAESQVLQGWLMHDRFLLRGAFGVPYEFLWANPYQPGLSYYHVPLIYHNPDFGKLFIRSSWEDAATWFGCFNGTMQLFQEGRQTVLDPRITTAPLELREALVFFGHHQQQFRAVLEEDEEVFVVGLKPRRMYLVEVDREEALEAASDAGGILPLDLPRKTEAVVRLRELDVAVPTRQRPETEERILRTRPIKPPEGQSR